MVAKQWLDSVESHLMSARLPRFYVRRLVRELSDHLELYMEEERTMSMDAISSQQISDQLGSSHELAEMAVSEYQRGSFVSRHPWLTFLAAPIPIFLVVVAFHTLAIIGLAMLLEGQTVNSRPMLMQVFAGIGQSLAFVPALIASGLLCYLAQKSDRDWRWQLTACALVAILAGMLNVVCQLPTQPGNGQFALGFGIGWTAFHLLQFALPLGIALLSIGYQWLRQRESGEMPQGASS